jgi:hypothetical protein
MLDTFRNNSQFKQQGGIASTSSSVIHGQSRGGFGALFVSTIDSIFDTRPPPFRILYQRDLEDGQISFGLF